MISRLPSPVSRLPSPVSRLPSPVSTVCRVASGLLALSAAFGMGNASDARAAAVCSDTPGSADWILCEENGASDIEIEADGVTIGTTGSGEHGIRGRHRGTGTNAATVRNSKITTAGALTDGVNARHEGSGKIKVYLHGTSIVTGGRNAGGIFGDHLGSGGIEIDVRDTDISTESTAVDGNGRTTSHGIWGWMRNLRGNGNIDIDVQGGSIRTAGTDSNTIYARHQGTGKIDIDLQGGLFETAGRFSHSIVGQHRGDGAVEISMRDATVVTAGLQAYGIFGWQQKNGDVSIAVRDTTVTTESTAVAPERPFNGRSTLAHGIYGSVEGAANTGSLAIVVRGGSVETAGADSNAVYGRNLSSGSGDVDIDIRGGSIRTTGARSYGIYGSHRGDGAVEISMRDATVVTAGLQAYGILGWQQKNGDVSIAVRDTTVTTESTAVAPNGRTSAHGILGLVQGAANTGSLAIDIRGGSIRTTGARSYGIYGSHGGSGDIEIATSKGHSVTTTGPSAHGIVAYHSGTASPRRITVTIGGRVSALGTGAVGVLIGGVSADGAAVGAAALDVEGLRQQTVTVNERVHGGPGSGANAAGLYLAGGGRVIIGPKGSVGAASGIAILATGDVLPPDPNPGNIQPIKPRLRVDMHLANRRLAEVIGNGWIINDGGGTTIYINNVKLHDSDTGVTGLSAPNGARNVRIRADGVKVTDRTKDGAWVITDPVAGVVADRDFSVMGFGDSGAFIEEYAPRAAVYEALPGFLLRFDAETGDERIAWAGTPVWARVAGGWGSYAPDHASVGAEFDFERSAAEAGFDARLSENVTGSISVRAVRGSADVTSSIGGGKIEAEGFGVATGVAVTLPDAWYARGRLSLTNYTLDIASSALGRLKSDIGALGRFLYLEAGKPIGVNGKMKLTPHGWITHSAFDMDAFTDSVDARVSMGGRSRFTGGLGMTAETVRAVENGNLSLRGSLGVERVFSGARTSVEVSGERLSSRSAMIRPVLGLGGRYRWDRFSLETWFSATGPGSDDTQYAGRVTFGIGF